MSGSARSSPSGSRRSSVGSAPRASTRPRPRASLPVSSTRPRARRSPSSTSPTSSAASIEAARSWRDDFAGAVVAEYGEERGSRLARAWSGAFPEAYKEDFNPGVGAADLGRLEAIEGDEGIKVQALFEQVDAGRGEARLKVSGSALRVRSAKSCRCSPRWASRWSTNGPTTHGPRPRVLIYEFGLRYGRRCPTPPARCSRTRCGRCGRLRDRRLYGLVLWLGLTWCRRPCCVREVHAEGNCLFRAGLHRGRAARNVDITRLRPPLRGAGRPRVTCRAAARAEVGIERPTSRPSTAWSASTTTWIRAYLTDIEALLRTNHSFQPLGPTRAVGGLHRYMSGSSLSCSAIWACWSRGWSSRCSSTRAGWRVCTWSACCARWPARPAVGDELPTEALVVEGADGQEHVHRAGGREGGSP